ncbi:MAG: hypothetical protein JWO01_2802, partial [Microbacteriaceae bacterium]|nr:hypothetical protein [Microbacteriaceae bacterium]
ADQGAQSHPPARFCRGDPGELFDQVTGLAVSHPVGQPGGTEFVPGPIRDFRRRRDAERVDKTAQVLGRLHPRQELIIVEGPGRFGAEEGQQSGRLLLQYRLGIPVMDGHDYTLTGTTDIPFLLIRKPFFSGEP